MITAVRQKKIGFPTISGGNQQKCIVGRWLERERKLYFRMLDALYAKSMFTQQQAMNIRLLGDISLYPCAAASLAQVELLMQLAAA